MSSLSRAIVPIAFCTLLSSLSQSWAGEIRAAVASNFSQTAKDIAERFEARTGHEVILVFGSTGKHYAQIVNGAPFHLFLAADSNHPRLLEEVGRAVAGSRFIYARGRLVLWSATPGGVDLEEQVLVEGDFRHLAIANPKLAPYGRAAREVLESLGQWNRLERRLVRGVNVAQAFQFVKSGNAEFGFVAYAQISQLGHRQSAPLWMIPQRLYAPIDQQAILLEDDGTARSFLEFLKGAEARAIIREYGYEIPSQRTVRDARPK